MVDMRRGLIALLLLASIASAIEYKNYGNASNVTSFSNAFDYASEVMETGSGFENVFGAIILLGVFLGTYILGSRYTQERAFVFAGFFSLIAGFFLVSANLLDPNLLILGVLAFIAAVYFSNRVGA